MATDLKSSKAQIKKLIQSEEFLDKLLSKLGSINESSDAIS